MELGIITFADLDPSRPPEQRMRELMEEAELADQLGLDVFGIGEHHRPDYLVSSPAVALAGAAQRTSNIRLTSAVSVLSSADPVRVFQDFATVDLLSGGRAEVMAGRGSFIESFPLFGYDLDDYDELFAEHLDLLLTLRDNEVVTWRGRHRAPIEGRGVYPRPVQDPLPVWLAVGGSPQSVVRAATLGLPLTLAIIGGMPARFKPFVDLYREAQREGGRPAADLPLAINQHAFVGDPDAFFPAYAGVMSRIGRERGWPPLTREQFDAGRSPLGHLVVGGPDEVAEKILAEHELFGMQRFMAHTSMGNLPHADAMRSLERFGTEVAPVVRAEVARRTATAQPVA